MENFKDEALNTVKMLLQIDHDNQDKLLLFLIDDVRNSVMGYCHTESVPSKLDSLIPIMAADLFRIKTNSNSEKEVHSISEGERSIIFENSYNTNDFIKEYEARLKPFVNRFGKVPSEI